MQLRTSCGWWHRDRHQRRRSESNRRIEVLQTSALPLGYGAVRHKLAIYLDFLNPPREVLPTSFKPLSCRTLTVPQSHERPRSLSSPSSDCTESPGEIAHSGIRRGA